MLDINTKKGRRADTEQVKETTTKETNQETTAKKGASMIREDHGSAVWTKVQKGVNSPNPDVIADSARLDSTKPGWVRGGVYRA